MQVEERGARHVLVRTARTGDGARGEPGALPARDGRGGAGGRVLLVGDRPRDHARERRGRRVDDVGAGQERHVGADGERDPSTAGHRRQALEVEGDGRVPGRRGLGDDDRPAPTGVRVDGERTRGRGRDEQGGPGRDDRRRDEHARPTTPVRGVRAACAHDGGRGVSAAAALDVLVVIVHTRTIVGVAVAGEARRGLSGA